jgi:hypothetical protein
MGTDTVMVTFPWDWETRRKGKLIKTHGNDGTGINCCSNTAGMGTKFTGNTAGVPVEFPNTNSVSCDI